MKEQIQRLNKRPGVETQKGQLATGTTKSTKLGYVQQERTKGQKLASTLGIATKTAFKAVELYQGQKKEEASVRVNKEKYEWMDELNELPSDADRTLWIQSKIQEVSADTVDPHYRNNVIGALDGVYKTYSEGATKEGHRAQQGVLVDDLMTSIGTEGKLDYESITATYPSLPKKFYHEAVAKALTKQLQYETTSIKTPTDLKAFNVKKDSLLAEYRKNSFTGGSNSAEAIDIQLKVDKSLKAINTAFTTQFKDEADLLREQAYINVDVTPSVFDKKEDDNLKQGFTDKTTNYQNKAKYKKKYDTKIKIDNVVSNYNLFDASNNINYSNLPDDEKKAVKKHITSNLDISQNAGNWESFAYAATNNPSAGKPRMQNTFDNFTTADTSTIQKNLTMFDSLQDVTHGGKALTMISDDAFAFYSILSTNPAMDAETLRTNIADSKGLPIKFGEIGANKRTFNKNKEKWADSLGGLSLKEQGTARRLLQVYSNTGMDPEDAIDKVYENFIKLDTQESSNGMVFRGFSGNNVDYIEDGLTNYILKDSGLDMGDVSIAFDKGIMTVTDPENPLMPVIEMPYNDFVEAIASLKASEVVGVETDPVDSDKTKYGSTVSPTDVVQQLTTKGTTTKSLSYSEVFSNTKDSLYKAVDSGVNSVLDFLSPTQAQGSDLSTGGISVAEQDSNIVFNNNIGWLEGAVEHKDIVDISTTPYGINRSKHAGAIKQYAKDLNKQEKDLTKQDYKALSNSMYNDFKGELDKIEGFTALPKEQQAAVTFAKFNTGTSFKGWIKSFTAYNKNPTESNFKEVIKQSTRSTKGTRVKGLDNRALKELVISGVVDLKNKPQMKIVLSILTKADVTKL